MRAILPALIPLVMTLPLTASAQTAPGTTRWADSVARLIDAALLAGNPAGFDPAIALADRVLTIAPNDGMMLHYKGYALYRKATLLVNATDRPQDAAPLLEEADDVLTRSAERLAWPETPAVHASVVGQQIAIGGMLAGMRLGSRSSELMSTATRLGPDNPRVLMLRGISALFTPRMFGGGSDKALADLLKSTERFATERVTPPAPSWGHAEAWAWLGQAYVAEKRYEDARRAYERALVVQPDNAWVKHQLLPALDRVRR